MQSTQNLFERRLVAYIDILGWSEASKTESDRVATAAKLIHDAANDYSTNTKNAIERLSSEARGEANPMYMAVQVGALSDSYALSMPVGFGLRIYPPPLRLALNFCSWASSHAAV